MKIKLSQILRILMSISLLGILFWLMRGKYDTILTELKKTNLALFFSAFLLFCSSTAFVTLRLRAILVCEGIKMPIVQLMELNFIGYFFNNFMPSAVGGDIVKAYYTGLLTQKRAKSYVSVFMDRLVGFFSFALIGFIAMLISWNTINTPSIKKSVLFFVVLCLLATIVSLNVKIAIFVSKILIKIRLMNAGDKLVRIYNIIHNYRNKKAVLFKTLFISLISQSIYFIVIYILFVSLNLKISFMSMFLVMPIVSIISMLPSIGGLGLRESAIVALFGPMIGNEKAFGVSILLLANLFLISIIGGIIYLISPQFRNANLVRNIDSNDNKKFLTR